MEKPFHILFTNKKKAWSGEPAIIESLGLKLIERGHRISVFTHPESSLKLRLVDSEIQTIDFSFEKNPPGVAYSFFKRGFKIAKFIKEEKVDLVHSASSFDTWVASFAVRNWFSGLKSIPLVRTKHNLSKIRPNLTNRWYYSKGMTKIIAPSIAVKQQLEESPIVPNQSIAYIPHGIDLDEIRSFQGTQEEARKELGLDDETQLILFSGRIVPNKDPETAVRAVNIASKKYPKLKLWLAGAVDPYTKKDLEEIVENDCCQVLGHRNDIPRLLKAADFYIQPSVKEAFGLAALEALLMKIPTVVSDALGFKDFVEDRKNALVFPMKDPKALADCLIELIEKPEMAQRLASTGEALVLDKFHLDRMVDDTEQLYRELL